MQDSRADRPSDPVSPRHSEGPPARRGPGGPVLAGVLVALVSLGVLFWWFTAKDTVPPLDETRPAVVESPRPAEEPVEPEPLPEDADATVRAELARLSALPAWRAWLAQDDMARRTAGAVQTISEGLSPRPFLGFLAPEGRFRVRRSGGRTYIAEASFDRYDAVAALAGTVDPQKAAEVYRRLRPLFEAAWREIGRPGTTFEQALQKAIERVTRVAVPEGAIEVEPKGGIYVFADPRLEQADEVAKHVIRIGRRNATRVQAALTAFGRAAFTGDGSGVASPTLGEGGAR